MTITNYQLLGGNGISLTIDESLKTVTAATSGLAFDTIVAITDADFTTNVYTVATADLGKLFVVDLSGAAVTQTIKLPDATLATKGIQTAVNYFDGAVQLDVTTVGGTQSLGDATTQSFNKYSETLTVTDNETGYLVRQDSRINKSGVDVLAWNTGVTDILDLEDETAHFFSSGRLSGSAITKGATTVDAAEGQWYLRNADSDDAPLKPALVSAVTGLAIPEGDTSYIVADYNGGTPTHSVVSDITAVPCQSSCVSSVVSRVNADIDVLDIGGFPNDFMAKYMRASAVTGWLKYGSGLMVSAVGTSQFAITAGSLYIGVQRYDTPALDTATGGTFKYYYRKAVSGWNDVASSTTINTTQYDTGTGSLITGAVGKYYVHRIYARINNPTEFAVIYPQVAHNSLADAQANAGPISTVPEFGNAFSTGSFIGSIITKYNTAVFQSILSPFVQVLGTATPTTHNNLSGLNLGDYLHLTAAEYAALGTYVALTGNQTVAGVKTFSSSPIVPAPTTDLQAATKKYVDDNGGGVPAGATTQIQYNSSGAFAGDSNFIWDGSSVIVNGSQSFTGEGIRATTSDGTDNSNSKICGGGAFSTTRGAYIICNGNEASSQPGRCTITSGDTSGSDLALNVGSTDGTIYLNPGSSGVEIYGQTFLANETEPGTPSGGGVMYVESGALKYKGSSGTVTTLGVA